MRGWGRVAGGVVSDRGWKQVCVCVRASERARERERERERERGAHFKSLLISWVCVRAPLLCVGVHHWVSVCLGECFASVMVVTISYVTTSQVLVERDRESAKGGRVET